MMATEELLDQMLEWGFEFIALEGKRPVDKNWTELGINDKDIITISKKNWGVNCGSSRLFVVDIDIKGDKHGAHELEKLEAEYSKLPDTFTVRTPSGGLHLYFVGYGPTTSSTIAPGIDTRSLGGQVVSPLVEGYEVIKNRPPVAVPDWILDLAGSKDKDTLNLEDTPEIGEGERNDQLTRWAGSFRGQGMTEQEVYQAIQIINERCDPPVDDEELQTIASSVSRYKTEEAKRLSKDFDRQRQREIDFATYKTEQGEKMPVAISTLTGTPQPRIWLINDWIPQGEIGSIYGSGGSGKSLLALQLGYAIATASEWAGLKPECSMPVLAVCCEDDQNEVHRRVNSFRVPNTPGEENFFVWSRVGEDNVLVTETRDGKLETSLFYDLLEEYLANMPKGPKLLILDTLADIYMANENDRMMVNYFIKYHLGRLAQKYDLTILMIAHPSRSGMKTKDLLSGSTGWENSVRFRLNFVEHEDNPEIMVLTRAKSNYSKRGEEIYLRWKMGAFVPSQDVSPVSELVVDMELLDIIDSTSNTDIAVTDFRKEAYKLGYNFTRSTLERRLKQGIGRKAERDGKTYLLTKKSIVCLDGKYRSNIWVIEIGAQIVQIAHEQNEQVAENPLLL